MATSAHQSHNIPWQVLADLIWAEEVAVNGRMVTRLQLRKGIPDIRLEKAIGHFARKFINEFANTEASKYSTAAPFEKLSHSKIYPDSICSSSSILVPGKLQLLSSWKEPSGGWHSGHGHLADVIKELFNLDQFASVLYMVRNGIQLHKLAFITYSNCFHYGIRTTLESSLELYLQFNLFLAMDLLNGAGHEHWPSMLKEARAQFLQGRDFSAEYLFPRQWFKREGIDFWASWKPSMNFFFKCLYQYEVMSRELGRPVDWQVEVEHVLGLLLWPTRYVPLRLEYIDWNSFTCCAP